jgi:large subunit ribosomal protein L30
MLAVIRIRGRVEVSKGLRETLDSMGLRKINTMIIVDEKMKSNIRKVNSHTAWGELESGLLNKFKGRKIVKLSPPRGGFKSLKKSYPKGDLGYRGSAINELIKRMM